MRGSFVTRRPPARAILLACGLCAMVPAPSLRAADNPVILQWFETSWPNIERRAPDIFMAGYGAMWVPSPSLASDASAGYDPFERFNLGTPAQPTAFGTEEQFRQFLREVQRADVLVYPESIMNHNGARSSNTTFLLDGGWPGFHVPGNAGPFLPGSPPFLTSNGSQPWVGDAPFTLAGPTHFWGDFHQGNLQSENPGAGNYNLYLGDLVGLVDIAHESNYSVIRHPTGPDPRNIPPGRVRNRPNPANARFYPDLSLPPRTFTNTGNPFGGADSWTLHPFNTADPAAGDAVPENATGLLMRWTRWMLEDVRVDGFRLDAAKHIQPWFWSSFWDVAVHQTRRTPDGRIVTPYSFGEVVGDFALVQQYVRKDGFANRDVLDLSGAGALRDNLRARGFGSWDSVLAASVDRANDNQHDGDQGVHHVYSHDNGSQGDGGAPPRYPTLFDAALPQHAYALLRPGAAIVYHYGREMISRYATQTGPNSWNPTTGRFWPREGNPTALGNATFLPGPTIGSGTRAPDAARLTTLVRLHNQYARGGFRILTGAGGTDPGNFDNGDVLVFERGTGAASLLVAVNDRYDAGFQQRNVQTSFPPGTRLHELTGNAADPAIDPAGQIPETFVVGADGRLRDPANPAGPVALLRVPSNAASIGGQSVEHHRGYVVYGPRVPAGTLAVTPVASTLAADPDTVPDWRRRLTSVDVITAPTFDVQLSTVKADPLDVFPGDPTADGGWDDNALLRFNQGYIDLNGDGLAGEPFTNPIAGGYESFLTQRSPIAGPGGTRSTGLYRQSIVADALPEGLNYLSVIAYRRRIDGGQPIFAEFRKVLYVDRQPPAVAFADPIPSGAGATLRVRALDATTNAVHILLNPPAGVDPRTLVTDANRAAQHDRLEWRRTFTTLTGRNRVVVVAFEATGNSSVIDLPDFVLPLGSGDVDRNGRVDQEDLYAIWPLTEYRPEADLDRNGTLTPSDRTILEARLRGAEPGAMRQPQR